MALDKYTPLEWIMISIANHYGLDKELFPIRIKWVNEREHMLEDLVDSAEDKYQYAAAVMALREVQAGEATGYLVGLDACSSGPAIMSAFMRDEVGARNTGLIGKVRADIYKKTTSIMNNTLGSTRTYPRKTVKKALMPMYYGSQAKPKEIFGEGEELRAFYDASEKVAPGASKLMPIMINAWQPWALEHSWTMADGFCCMVKVTQKKETKVEIDELPGHPTFMYQFEKVEGEESGVANAANITQGTDGLVVREMNRRCNYNWGKLSNVYNNLMYYLNDTTYSPSKFTRIQDIWYEQQMMTLAGAEDLEWEDIKHLDRLYAEELCNLIKRHLDRPSFPVIMVHDEFKCHANYVNWMRLTYNEILAEISDSNMIESMLSELTGQNVVIDKFADSISAEILKAEYSLS